MFPCMRPVDPDIPMVEDVGSVFIFRIAALGEQVSETVQDFTLGATTLPEEAATFQGENLPEAKSPFCKRFAFWDELGARVEETDTLDAVRVMELGEDEESEPDELDFFADDR